MSHPKKLLASTLIAAALIPLATATATTSQNPSVVYNNDGTVNCVMNGYRFSDPSGYAPANSCFHTIPQGGLENLPPALAEVNPNLTEQDLVNVENTSVLSPGSQIGQDTYSHQPLTGNEPISPLSKEMTANFQQSNYMINHWSTGENAGQIGDARYAAHENIPVYTVDSSNPHQNYIWIQARDPRATSVPGYDRIMAGKIPFPKWALKDRGWSGDKSVAIYDKATGIWRSMYYFGGIGEDGKFVNTTANPDTPLQHTEDGLPIYTYASGGYILGEPDFQGLGYNNYWATLQGGTSSVAGMANELTQIGVDEIRAGEINHAISMTAADYYTSPASFPAKQSDGRINMIVSEGSGVLDGSEYSKRFRVSSFASGKIDTALNDRYRRAMLALDAKGVIDIDDNFNIVSSKISADTDTKALAKELGLDRVHETHAEFVKRYLAEGDMLQVTDAPMPYTPKTGQRFTIPADVDVEALADKHGLSEFDRMRLRAIQKYGGILTDRNGYVHAFNLEAAASYAPYAREGKNVYLEDPEIVEKLKGSNSHAFPWQAVVWIDENFTGWEGDTGVKDTSQHWNMEVEEGQLPTVYLPDSYNDQVYAGQDVYLNPNAQAIMPRGMMFHAPWFKAEYVSPQVAHHHEMSWNFRAGSAPEDARQVLELNTVGYMKVDSTLGRLNSYVKSTSFNLDNPTAGSTLQNKVLQSAELSDAYRTEWNVATVDPASPIARTDTAKVVRGQSTVIDPMANDEAYMGAKAHERTAAQYEDGWGRITLVNENGEDVSSLTSDGVTYTVISDNKIVVDAGSADLGFVKPVQYKTLRFGQGATLAGFAASAPAGQVASQWSAPGTIQAQVYSSFGAEAPVVDEPTPTPTAEPTVAPEPTAEPTIEPTVEPSAIPTDAPTAEPTQAPSVEPSMQPTVEPTVAPEPTAEPSLAPSAAPTAEPSSDPTAEPTVEPTEAPEPTDPIQPVTDPSANPTDMPVPTFEPTDRIEPAAPAPEETAPSDNPVEQAPVENTAGDSTPAEEQVVSVENIPAPSVTTPAGVVPDTGIEGQAVAAADSTTQAAEAGTQPGKGPGVAVVVAVGLVCCVAIGGGAYAYRSRRAKS